MARRKEYERAGPSCSVGTTARTTQVIYVEPTDTAARGNDPGVRCTGSPTYTPILATHLEKRRWCLHRRLINVPLHRNPVECLDSVPDSGCGMHTHEREIQTGAVAASTNSSNSARDVTSRALPSAFTLRRRRACPLPALSRNRSWDHRIGMGLDVQAEGGGRSTSATMHAHRLLRLLYAVCGAHRLAPVEAACGVLGCIETGTRVRRGWDSESTSNIRGAGNGIDRHWSASFDVGSQCRPVEIQRKPLARDGSH
ncbi:hypothetical protein B0H11DRAFT_2385848 [Mycena galericulata]|nr:hypothetical protein B0H11DRAFT_2385848 [Mycena galericulata]